MPLIDQFIHYNSSKQLNAKEVRNDIKALLNVDVTIKDVADALSRAGYIKCSPAQIKQRVGYITRVYWRNESMLYDRPVKITSSYSGEHKEAYLWLVFNNADYITFNEVQYAFPELSKSDVSKLLNDNFKTGKARYTAYQDCITHIKKVRKSETVAFIRGNLYLATEYALGKQHDMDVRGGARRITPRMKVDTVTNTTLKTIDLEEYLCDTE